MGAEQDSSLAKAQAVDAVSLLVGRAGVRRKERWGQRMRSWKRRERGPNATMRDGGPRVCTGPGLGTQVHRASSQKQGRVRRGGLLTHPRVSQAGTLPTSLRDNQHCKAEKGEGTGLGHRGELFSRQNGGLSKVPETVVRPAWRWQGHRAWENRDSRAEPWHAGRPAACHSQAGTHGGPRTAQLAQGQGPGARPPHRISEGDQAGPLGSRDKPHPTRADYWATLRQSPGLTPPHPPPPPPSLSSCLKQKPPQGQPRPTALAIRREGGHPPSPPLRGPCSFPALASRHPYLAPGHQGFGHRQI